MDNEMFFPKLLFATIVLLAVIMAPFNFGTGEVGQHTGKVVDVSEAGWICKTYEATIISGEGNAAIQHHVTVTSKEVQAQLTKALESGDSVIVKYRSPRVFLKCTGAFNNFVYEAKINKPNIPNE